MIVMYKANAYIATFCLIMLGLLASCEPSKGPIKDNGNTSVAEYEKRDVSKDAATTSKDISPVSQDAKETSIKNLADFMLPKPVITFHRFKESSVELAWSITPTKVEVLAYKIVWKNMQSGEERHYGISFDSRNPDGRYEIIRLTPGVRYQVKVQSHDGGTGSEWSDVIEGVVGASTR